MKKLFVIGAFAFIASCTGPSKEEKALVERIDSLENEIAALKRANDTLSEHLATKSYLTKDYPNYFDSIAEPERHLLENLREDQNSIPKDAVLGGTMQFTKVSFVNDQLIVAEYEDGHVMGKAVYTYSVKPSGDLEFSLLGTIR